MTTRKMTPKQTKFVKEYIKTLNATEAAMRSYDCKDRLSARNIGSELLANLGTPIQRLLNKKGYTDEMLIEDMLAGVKAQKPVVVNGKLYKTEDWTNRHKYIETITKLKDLFPNSKMEIMGKDGAKEITIRLVEDTTLYDASEIQEAELLEDDEL